MEKKISLLDCTLRDGGYVNNWDFSQKQILSTVDNLTKSNIDYIELGYLTSITSNVNGTQFGDMQSVVKYLPKDKNHSKYVVMADVAQFDTSTLIKRTAETAEGIRVVFYKRQVKQAFEFCKSVVELGYDLFLQPMVTVDYTTSEFCELVKQFCENYPLYSVAIVDSFGCMTRKDIDGFVTILHEILPRKVKIGLHSHNNMNLSMQNSLLLFDYSFDRDLVIDCSVNGIGRGAGNLQTELIADYYNREHNGGYDLQSIIQIMSDVTEPISRNYKWGYSPYFMLTAMYKAHPNFATFMLAERDISVSEFSEFLELIPEDMLTKCTRPYVNEIYEQFAAR